MYNPFSSLKTGFQNSFSKSGPILSTLFDKDSPIPNEMKAGIFQNVLKNRSYWYGSGTALGVGTASGTYNYMSSNKRTRSITHSIGVGLGAGLASGAAVGGSLWGSAGWRAGRRFTNSV